MNGPGSDSAACAVIAAAASAANTSSIYSQSSLAGYAGHLGGCNHIRINSQQVVHSGLEAGALSRCLSFSADPKAPFWNPRACSTNAAIALVAIRKSPNSRSTGPGNSGEHAAITSLPLESNLSVPSLLVGRLPSSNQRDGESNLDSCCSLCLVVCEQQ